MENACPAESIDSLALFKKKLGDLALCDFPQSCDDSGPYYIPLWL